MHMVFQGPHKKELNELTDDIISQFEMAKNTFINQSVSLLKIRTHLKISPIIKLTNLMMRKFLIE